MYDCGKYHVIGIDCRDFHGSITAITDGTIRQRIIGIERIVEVSSIYPEDHHAVVVIAATDY